MKKPSVFAARPGHYTIRDNDGRVATTFATCQFDALLKARNLWPDASEWTAAFVAAT
jgi:hypothetical protein